MGNREFIRNRLCVYLCFIRRGRVVLILIGIKMGYIMKKILCFIGILVSCQSCMIQKSFTRADIFRANANRLKTEVNFAQWSGKNEPMRVAPVLLNLFRFPTITDKSPFTRKSLARRTGTRPPNVERTLHHQYLLSDRQKKIGWKLIYLLPLLARKHKSISLGDWSAVLYHMPCE